MTVKMPLETKHVKTWTGEFGKEYTDRNPLSLQEMDDLYQNNFGLTRTELNQQFISDLSRSNKILEVGSNIGLQLLFLQKMGFENLYGIEIQSYAVELSKSKTKGINIIQGSAFDIPFKDSYFEMVFTSGVLIHISPSDIDLALNEIHRCSSKYIWGFEYFAEKYTEIPYRGQKDLLWKTDFARLFLDRFKDLELVKEKRIKYIASDNVDNMYLLRKK
jgi:pseudaminic acid biosynthesis-associated methylase